MSYTTSTGLYSSNLEVLIHTTEFTVVDLDSVLLGELGIYICYANVLLLN